MDGPGAVASGLDGIDCDAAAPQNAPSPVARHIIPEDVTQEPQNLTGPGSHTTNSVYADSSVMSVPTSSVPAPVPPSVMTTMYHHQIVSGLPLSNVYVGNVTANVNVHGYVSAYPHISPQQVYPAEVPHESANSAARNGGREARRGRSSKMGNKRVDGQYGDRNSLGRHTQEVIQVQPSSLVESPPTGNSNIPQQGFTQFFPISPMHHPYYNPSTPTHPAPHLPHHLSAQHATGTPIYLSGHPIYPPPMYGAYTPHHQPPGAPPIMSFTAMQSAPVPTTETSVLGSYQVEGSGAEEQMPAAAGNKEVELGEANVHQQKVPPSSVCTTLYQLQPLPEVCQPSLNSNAEAVASSGHNNTKPTSYQQQQSEEEDFNQTNLVNTVVVNNSNITTEPPPFVESKQSGVVDSGKRNLAHQTGHDDFIKSDLEPKFVSEKVKVSTQDVLVDSNVLLNQAPRVNVGETAVNGNLVVSDFDVKKDRTVISGVNFPSAVEECQSTDVKSPLPCVDVSSSAGMAPKSTLGPVTDSVAPFTGSPQPVSTSVAAHQASGQNVTPLSPASHPVDVTDTSVTTPVQKSWASLFKTCSTIDAGMMVASTSPVSGTPSGNKPLACVKPFQNAVPVVPDTSHRVSGGSSAPCSVSPAVNPGVNSGTGDSVNSFPQFPSPSSTDDPHLYQLGGGFSSSTVILHFLLLS